MEHKDKNSLTASRQIEYAIRFFAGRLGLKTPVFATATVTKVNEAERTCSVSVLMGDLPTDLDEVNLLAENGDGLLKLPAIGSSVQIKMLPDNTCYVTMFSDLDAVVCFIDETNEFRFDKNGFVWNQGINGGMIKIDLLTTNINTLIATLNTNLTAIAAAITSLGGTYAPTPATPFVKSNYEDTSVKH